MPALAWKTLKRVSVTAVTRYKVRAVVSARRTCAWSGVYSYKLRYPVRWNSRRAVSAGATIEWKVGKAIQGNILIAGADYWEQAQ